MTGLTIASRMAQEALPQPRTGRARVRGATWLVVLCVGAATAGCSDDGLAPLTNDGSTSAAQGGTTGTITTTATATSPSDATGQPTTDPTTEPDSGMDTQSGDTFEIGDSSSTGSPGGSSRGEDGTGDDTGMSSATTGDIMLGEACESDEDCVLVDTCCDCTGEHVDDAPALEDSCQKLCAQSSCDAAGLSGQAVECRFGTCQLADVECNQALVLCDEEAPDCPDGSLPSISDGCWTNNCVPPEACDVVPDCTWCEEGETCVQTATQLGQWSSCEPVDPSCVDEEPTCACMGNEICTNPFMCSEGLDGLDCFCPVC